MGDIFSLGRNVLIVGDFSETFFGLKLFDCCGLLGGGDLFSISHRWRAREKSKFANEE